MARVYADVNTILGPAWYDYGPLMLFPERGRSLLNGTLAESTKIDWNVPDRYEIIQRIGGGKYSDVRSRSTQTLPVGLDAHRRR